MSKRKKIPKKIETEVLIRCKRRCCICFCIENDDRPKQNGQIAHIDRNKNNNAQNNLVYLCLRHHDQYDSRTSQSKGFTESEVRHYREQVHLRFDGTLEQRVTETDLQGLSARNADEKVDIKQLWGVGGFVIIAFFVVILAITVASRFGGGFWRFIAAIIASFIVLVVLAIIGRFMGVFGEETVVKFLDTALAALKLGIRKGKSEDTRLPMEGDKGEIERLESKIDTGEGPGIGSGTKETILQQQVGGQQVIQVNKSREQKGGVNIGVVEKGATVNITIIDYQDGLAEAPIAQVRTLFKQGRDLLEVKDYKQAITKFESALGLEKDAEKLGALNVQIGNCYYEQRKYIKAAEFYAAALRKARQADDREGEGSAIVCIGNSYAARPAADAATRGRNIVQSVEQYTKALKLFPKDEYPVQYAMTQNNLGNVYTDLPCATSEERSENVRKAIDCYIAVLEIYRKDEYPVQYAMTQNNLGNAYRDLPSATTEERSENVRKAIECYRAALEIRKKDEYPFDYATTQNNLGGAYTELPSAISEECSENVRKAIECYLAALEIFKKDEYPQSYCSTAANLGMLLADIDEEEACHWLREAYSLREYLPDQGKRLEELIDKVCNKD